MTMSDDQDSIFRKESLERLSSPEQLDQLMQVVSPRSWLPLSALAGLVGLALLWGIFGRIPVTATAEGILVRPAENAKELVSLSYFKSEDGSRIRPGMKIIIVPDGDTSPNGISAAVQSISQPSLTTLEAVRRAQSAKSTLIQEDTVEVLSTFPSPDALAPGTPTTARIVLDQKAPIAFVLPF